MLSMSQAYPLGHCYFQFTSAATFQLPYQDVCKSPTTSPGVDLQLTPLLSQCQHLVNVLRPILTYEALTSE
jgi:hypothetical protein